MYMGMCMHKYICNSHGSQWRPAETHTFGKYFGKCVKQNSCVALLLVGGACNTSNGMKNVFKVCSRTYRYICMCVCIWVVWLAVAHQRNFLTVPCYKVLCNFKASFHTLKCLRAIAYFFLPTCFKYIYFLHHLGFGFIQSFIGYNIKRRFSNS